MRSSRVRLVNAARRSMMQRAELRRKLGIARDAAKPTALINRGKYRVNEGLGTAARSARTHFNDNRLPIILAAVAGTAWLLRKPIKEQAPRLGHKLQRLAATAMDRLRPTASHQANDNSDVMENDDEALY